MSQTVTKTIRVGQYSPTQIAQGLQKVLRAAVPKELAESIASGVVRMWDGNRKADLVLSNQVLQALGLPAQHYAQGVGLVVKTDGTVEVIYDHAEAQTAAALERALPALVNAGVHWRTIHAVAVELGRKITETTVNWETAQVQVKVAVGGAAMASTDGEAPIW